ncbi:MAG: sensor histidine kinase [Bacteroides sp.]|uniref:sensor histidine kinase n=1 Tax=Bacteroides sp. TaxID=29523 RepID=UPI0026E0CC93|nr:sensor histidine kinase [Bacteroides sp.]MDO5420860.1 sensor histidine kinase [Bacteroides sp.]
MGVLLISTTILVLFCIIYQIIRRQNKVSQLRENFSYDMIHDMKTPLSSIIMSNHALGSGKLDAKPIRSETKFKTDTVMADKEYLQEDISNLIDNALKYSRQGITIRITTQEEAGYHLINKCDNGIKGKRIAGFGLGLDYVCQVMQTHEGKVSVESREGEYSEFTLHLPQS